MLGDHINIYLKNCTRFWCSLCIWGWSILMILPLVVLVGIFLIAFKSYLICCWFYFWEWLILHTFWTHQWQPFKEENLEKNTQIIHFSKWNIHLLLFLGYNFQKYLNIISSYLYGAFLASISLFSITNDNHDSSLKQDVSYYHSSLSEQKLKKNNFKRNLWQELPKDFKKKNKDPKKDIWVVKRNGK